MRYLVNAEEIKHYDHYTINKIGIPALVLMERAALAAVEVLLQGDFKLDHIAIICGYGNNGADGIALARLLTLKDYQVTLYLVGDETSATTATKQQLVIAKHYAISPQTLPTSLAEHTTLVDALFGVGLSRPINDDYAHVIDLMNQSQIATLAIDMPSGICASSGQILGCAVTATKTVTFGYQKVGSVLFPGNDYCGTVIVKDIGINQFSFDNQPPQVLTYQPEDVKALLPPRNNQSNKGSFGKVLVIAGSETMSGAAYFSAKAAYKTGAGLVRVYTPTANRTILLSQLPEAILTCYEPQQLNLNELRTMLDWPSVIVVGPGMGQSEHTHAILTTVLAHAKVPLIIDADGLNVLAQQLELLNQHQQPIIITPHLGEMARLTTKSIADISANLLGEAKQFADHYQLTCVLKDARTVVACPDSPLYLNQSGNNGMATAGSGDILTGIIAGLIGQHMPVAQAAKLAVYLHGLAGDQARQTSNQYSMIAEDIINGLNQVMALH